MHKRETQILKSKTVWLVSLAFVVIAAACLFYLFNREKQVDTSNNNSSAQQSNEPIIDNTPATKQDQAGSDTAKDNHAAAQDKPTNTPSDTKKVTPIISRVDTASATTVEVNAFVSGVVEDSGQCTLVAKNGSATVTKTSPGQMNATTTTCASFIINKSEFPIQGTWNLTVSYSSSNAQGVSQSSAMVLP